jgi:hypothetical protein
MCVEEVKDLPKVPRYFALSYVWGGVTQLQLLWDNLIPLSKKGSLESDYYQQIPKVIRDAITITQDLDETYLWVDALCICQDDPWWKASQIAMMNQIYKGAVLTVVALDAGDASSKLPGVGIFDEPRVPHIAKFDSIRLKAITRTLEERTMELSEESCARWPRRAWMF